MTASVRLMMQELAAESATMSSLKASPGFSQSELGAGVVAMQVTASEAVNAVVTSHQEALNVSINISQQLCRCYSRCLLLMHKSH